jgi:hypothetical protein
MITTFSILAMCHSPLCIAKLVLNALFQNCRSIYAYVRNVHYDSCLRMFPFSLETAVSLRFRSTLDRTKGVVLGRIAALAER